MLTPPDANGPDPVLPCQSYGLLHSSDTGDLSEAVVGIQDSGCRKRLMKLHRSFRIDKTSSDALKIDRQPSNTMRIDPFQVSINEALREDSSALLWNAMPRGHGYAEPL